MSGSWLARAARRIAGRYRAPVQAANPVPKDWQGQVSLFLLAGQSNMAGYSPLPAGPPRGHPRAFVFGNDYRWRPSGEPTDSGVGQVDMVSFDPLGVPGFSLGYSPATAFALELLRRDPGLLIGLVPCSRGGSSLAEWQRDLSDDTLYGSCLKRARAASTMGQVAGVLFLQGEAEGAAAPGPAAEAAAHTWAERFQQLVLDWRADLGQPDLPIVFGQIGTVDLSAPYWSVVQAQQSGVRMPRVSMVQTLDLPRHDFIHFSTAAQEELGARYAEAYWLLTRG